ncbi:MAG: hypothetical protein B7Y80_08220 [Hyphomicrobium sp. 32-62-53]|nr:MAG: hypothetical protein B7Z29_16170 [Hyphomicrobium sp. 12-62-95]OYY00122.1 MAG: hypothetical protein B7Y80_08220 [Hyphomicrobium sp. 32-62-53]
MGSPAIGGVRLSGLGVKPLAQAALIAGLSVALFAAVWLYGAGLRDARYLDGWLLASGMILQIYFHVALKTTRLSPKAVARWRALHILLGYVLIAAFLSHANFSLPDTGMEWALWLGFFLVAASGVFGTYLSWSLKLRHSITTGFNFDRIPTRREEIAKEVYTAVTQDAAPSQDIPLPDLPYDVWILDLYANHLRDFLQAPRHFTAHLLGTHNPGQRLIDEIETLSRFVDPSRQEKLAAIKSLVIEKDGLDFARVHLLLTRGWLFVHVPVTYALIVISVLHVIVVYAYSSGAW